MLYHHALVVATQSEMSAMSKLPDRITISKKLITIQIHFCTVSNMLLMQCLTFVTEFYADTYHPASNYLLLQLKATKPVCILSYACILCLAGVLGKRPNLKHGSRGEKMSVQVMQRTHFLHTMLGLGENKKGMGG